MNSMEKFRKEMQKMGDVETFDDHGVEKIGTHLEGKEIAVMVCGGIAAEKTPSLVRHFRHYGAKVRVYMTPDAENYVGKMNLEWSSGNKPVIELTSASEHLFRHDAYVVAPATANTIAKFAYGIADNAVTSALVSALGRMEKGKTKIFVVPTMHGSMLNSITLGNLETLIAKGVCVIDPSFKRGKANMPGSHDIVVPVIRELSSSPLRGKSLLVTAGCTPGWIDNVRMICNKFSGKLGIAIADEAYLRGADVKFIFGWSLANVPRYLETTRVKSYDEYHNAVTQMLLQYQFDCGIFSAAVADYIPIERKAGKIPSRAGLKEIALKETAKVIQKVRQQYPKLYMATFKYEEGITPQQLEAIAMKRTGEGYELVVANRGEEMKGEMQHSIIYDRNGKVTEGFTKREIAERLLDLLAQRLP